MYRVGHRAPSLEARYLAAVRACGPHAALSGKAAAFLYELIRGAPPRPEVTSRTDRRVRGVLTRRSSSLEATSHRGVPITTVPRTLIDVAPKLTAGELARACHEAGVKYGTTPAQVKALTTRLGPKLRQVLEADVRVSLSKLETRFIELLRDTGLVLPVTNRLVDGRRIDCR